MKRDKVVPDVIHGIVIHFQSLTAIVTVIQNMKVVTPRITVIVYHVKTQTWSLHSQYKVSDKCFCIGGNH